MPTSGYSERGVTTGSAIGVRIEDVEELVDVDLLRRQPAAHDVVAGAHQLDAGAVEVGVEVAGAEPQRLARLQPDQVEQQRRRHAGVVGVALGESAHPDGLRPVAAGGRLDDRSDRDSTAVQRGERRLRDRRRPRARPSSSQTELGQQVERGGDGADPAERLERGQRAQELRLRERVRVAPGGEAGARLLSVGMGLQRERPGGGEDLEQVGKRSGDAPPAVARPASVAGPLGWVPSHSSAHGRPSAGTPRRCGMNCEVAPVVVLDHAADCDAPGQATGGNRQGPSTVQRP